MLQDKGQIVSCYLMGDFAEWRCNSSSLRVVIARCPPSNREDSEVAKPAIDLRYFAWIKIEFTIYF